MACYFNEYFTPESLKKKVKLIGPLSCVHSTVFLRYVIHKVPGVGQGNCM